MAGGSPILALVEGQSMSLRVLCGRARPISTPAQSRKPGSVTKYDRLKHISFHAYAASGIAMACEDCKGSLRAFFIEVLLERNKTIDIANVLSSSL
jgi:hypothetical protein